MTQDQLIPRAHLFGNPERAAPSINTTGTRIAFLAPKEGLLNVFVIDTDKVHDLDSATPVTNDTVRGIRICGWTEHPDCLWFMQDKGGDEEVCLTPADKTTNTPVGVSKDFPDHLLVMSNKRDPQFLDLHLINVLTGEDKMILENDESFAGFTPDHKFTSCVAERVNKDSSVDFYRIPLNTDSAKDAEVPKASAGTHFLHLTPENAGFGDTSVQGFSADLQSVYIAYYEGRDTSAFVKFNMTTKSVETVYGSDERADISGSLIDPVTYEPLAYQVNYDRKVYVPINKDDVALVTDFAKLDAIAGEGGEWIVQDKNADGSVLVVTMSKSDSAIKYYLYNRATQECNYLFGARPVLDNYVLNKMKAVERFEGTDGNAVTQPIPLIAHVHGGPYARDVFGFNRYHQFFADRGYAVISPQFRGSTGFGKSFLTAAKGEWSGKMHDDVIDACDWAVEQGIAIKEKLRSTVDRMVVMRLCGCHLHTRVLCLFCGYRWTFERVYTYGFYSCLLGTYSWDVGCPYWRDTDTEEGREFLAKISPIHKVDNICRPLLIGQGANDPRVKQAESDQIFDAMVAKGIPVTYVLYPDEGHGFARPPNSISFTAVTEAFLAKYLGGSAEAVGTSFEGSPSNSRVAVTSLGCNTPSLYKLSQINSIETKYPKRIKSRHSFSSSSFNTDKSNNRITFTSPKTNSQFLKRSFEVVDSLSRFPLL
ncbi:alpha/beta-hydrolase [Rhizoclosmatium globosum]|uniref:Dipeptidyl-peptidase V n=1 Tax=Rhizoclosmatium globosum TaxID=329046 RepID=A0A1Y2BX31_9FUNG|nr:alpha/beta-hydrolase [Rhizoclosmatium globosum]|eukprot:ORY39311.1 alpha/beta-hydrolase [Rhizoclosmatium globosum]